MANMNVDVHVSALLRSGSGGQGSFALQGNTIRELAEAIDLEYPGFSKSLMHPDGYIQKGILISLNGEMLPPGSGADTAVKEGDKVIFLKALAGG